MASLKLTKDVKRAIIEAVFEETIVPLEKKHKAEEHKLADELYQRTYGKYLQQMAALPIGYFASSRWIKVQVERSTKERRFFNLELPEPRMMAAKHCNYGGVAVESMQFGMRDFTLPERMWDWAKTGDSVSDQKRQLRRQLNSLMESVNTTTQLAEAWPEGAKYIPEAKKKTQLIKPPEELNAMIKELTKAA